MRTTIELKDEYRAALLQLAARRGKKGFSGLIEEAVETYLQSRAAEEARRGAVLRLRGALSRADAGALRRTTAAIRATWR